MAYNSAAPYQPPSRAYYGNPQSAPTQAPARPTYTQPPQHSYDHYGGQGHERGYEQGYDQGYEPTYDQNYGQGYDQGYGGYAESQVSHAQPPPAHHNGRYHEHRQYAQHPQQSVNGVQPSYKRSYDPRYQQEQPPPSRPHPAQAQHTSQRGPPQQPQVDTNGYPIQPNNQQRIPDNRMNHAQQDYRHQERDTYRNHDLDRSRAQNPAYSSQQEPLRQGQRYGDGISPPANGYRSNSPPSQQPKRSTMEEWKAKEKARMHTQVPEARVQDNAFPTFPTKRDSSRPSTRGGNSGDARERPSGDHVRPATSGTNQSRDHPRRNPMSQETASDVGYRPHDRHSESRRPSLDQQSQHLTERPGYFSGTSQQSLIGRQASNELIDDRMSPAPIHQNALSTWNGSQVSQYQQEDSRRQFQSQVQDSRLQKSARSNVDNTQQTHWPAHQQQVLPEQIRTPAQQPQSPTAQNPRYDYIGSLPHEQAPVASNTKQSTVDQRYASMDGHYDSRAPQDYFSQPIQPSQHQYEQKSASPAPVQPLRQHASTQPLTSTGISRSGTGYSGHVPPTSQLASPEEQQAYGADVRRSNVSQPPESAEDHGLSDLYDDYISRDDEIEAEMPDFDSAAPSQTSILHKRTQTVDRHLNDSSATSAPPPMPSLPSNPGAQSLPAQKSSMYPQENSRYAAQNQTTVNDHGFDFGDNVPKPQVYQQDLAYRPSSAPQQQQQQQSQQRLPNRPGQPPMQPPQTPLQSEHSMRRPKEGQMQTQYRQDPHPPPQRFYPNGQQMRGPPQGIGPGNPPIQRPETSQSFAGQSQRVAIPPQQRLGSAPPLRQGLQAPPGRMPSNPGVPPNGAMPLNGRMPPNGGLQQNPVQPQQRNPDGLPRHPVPVRPGLMEGGPMSSQPVKPPPTRNYDNTTTVPAPQPAAHSRQSSVDMSQPITVAELDRLRAAVVGNPNSMKASFVLAKRLNEASDVLASEGGRADAKTTARNREKYINDAYKRIKKLVADGYPDAQFYLGDCYSQGSLGLQIDSNEAFKYYQTAAKHNHPQAAYRTAVCCEIGAEEGGGTRKDYPKAVQWYRRAAALGDVAAMFKLGMILLKGLLGQQRQISEAVTWLKRAAEQADHNNPHALHELAKLYEANQTDPEIRNKLVPDEDYSRTLYQQAAGYGLRSSQFRLGQAHEYGQLGLDIDSRASISFYSKAAAQGEHHAELALSGWYLTGADGILEHNDTEAYLWARKAASSEPPLAKAMFAMGYFTEQGIGCPASLEEAKRWYGRAASYRFPKALERLEELKKNGKSRAAPANGKLSRKDQKRDEAECVVM
ncbi:chitin synthase regulatory factor 3 [Acrodontium crateriforme]|uniref:Chitin synthase regulatory factor 3 n=1 Tax=Acrodontium crateriforme TaxID=150365 RepID=A0AAQ3R512_9PEZI|nr:chitin synthase regulatory factor 3 [Acrodontium crateriforme]